MENHYEVIRYLLKIDNEEVLIANYPCLNKVVCVKIVKAKNIQHLKTILKEAESLKSVQRYPKAITLYHYFSEKVTNPLGYNLHLIMEYCSKGDLYVELEKRCKSKLFYKIEELLKIFYEFIFLFRQLQADGICHRDIKPRNIYITDLDELKIGDFGEAKIQIDFEDKHTIRGTPEYLSPKLAVAFREYSSGRMEKMANHNPFKSDVYSLGLVFLYMATLEKIDDRFKALKTVCATIRGILPQVPLEKLRDLIDKMLQFEEENRPDFINLYDLIKTFVCTICWNVCEDENKCLQCKSVYHYNCLTDLNCKVCLKSMGCTGCGRQCIQESPCTSHTYCNECRIINYSCSLCCGVSYLGAEEIDLSQFPLRIVTFCENCSAKFNVKTIQFQNICENCQHSYCGVCKGKHHSGLCLDTEDVIKRVSCRCGRCSEVRVDEIFMVCEFNCRFNGFCIVCYRDAHELSHAICVAFLQSKFLSATVIEFNQQQATVRADNSLKYTVEIEMVPIVVNSRVKIRLFEQSNYAIYLGRDLE